MWQERKRPSAFERVNGQKSVPNGRNKGINGQKNTRTARKMRKTYNLLMRNIASYISKDCFFCIKRSYAFKGMEVTERTHPSAVAGGRRAGGRRRRAGACRCPHSSGRRNSRYKSRSLPNCDRGRTGSGSATRP